MKAAEIKVRVTQNNAFGYMTHQVEVVSVGREESLVAARIDGRVRRAFVPNKNLRWLGN